MNLPCFRRGIPAINCGEDVKFDSFIALDLAADELIARLVEQAIVDARDNTTRYAQTVITELDAGRKPYHQLTMSWDAAIAMYESVHGQKFDMDKLLET